MEKNTDDCIGNGSAKDVNGAPSIVRIVGKADAAAVRSAIRRETADGHDDDAGSCGCSGNFGGRKGGHETDAVFSREHEHADGALLFLTRELDCPHCSALIVEDLRKLPFLKDASYNLLTRTLVLQPADGAAVPDDITEIVRRTVNGYEPDVSVEFLSDGNEFISDDEGGNEPPGFGMRTRLTVGFAVFVTGLILFYGFADNQAVRWTACAVLLAAYLISGYDVLRDAFRKIRSSFFSEQMLMTIASLGAVAIGEYPEAAAVMIFYQIGEYFQERAVNRSRASIKALLDICPDKANLETADGIREVKASDVRIGDRVVVRPGEKVPCDGIVVSGHSALDTSNLTGESVPRSVYSGDDVYSGFISRDGVITVEVRKKASDSAASEIVRMVEKAAERKSVTENFISVFAKYYTPAVVALAAVTAVIPPLLFGGLWSVWIERALIFLVVSCPCALVISIPLTYFSGIGVASKYGIMIKGSNYLDVMGRLGTVFFDKTGTLTRGTFKLSKIIGNGSVSEEKLLRLAGSAEAGSAHPIAKSVTEEAEKRGVTLLPCADFTEMPGLGIRAVIDGREVLVGNAGLFAGENIDVPEAAVGTVVHVAESKKYCGTLIIADEVKPDSARTVEGLRGLGIECIMLTGDNEKTASAVAGELKMSGYHAALFPENKVALVEAKLSKGGNGNAAVAFVGDGINDAPALAIADVGIAMGAMGSDAAIEAADAVIMSDEPSILVTGVRIARKTRIIVRQNIILALTVKFMLMILGSMGIIGMWFAVFGDVGVMILAVLNSMRMIFNRKTEGQKL